LTGAQTRSPNWVSAILPDYLLRSSDRREAPSPDKCWPNKRWPAFDIERLEMWARYADVTEAYVRRRKIGARRASCIQGLG
jgi:hypothetical protein